jgi:hypothetical protein
MDNESLKNPEKYFKSSNLMFNDIYESFSISKRSYESYSDFYSNRYINCQSGIYNSNNEFKKDDLSVKKPVVNHLKFKKSNLYDLYCASLHCKIDHLKIDESAIIRLRFRVWSSTLAMVSIFNYFKFYYLNHFK